MIRTTRLSARIAKWAALAVVFCVFVFPLLLVLLNSFKPLANIIINPLSLPQSWYLSNYVNAFQLMNFPSSFANSLIITVCSVSLIALCSSMTAYLFVRKKNRLTTALFYSMVSSMLIPFQALMIPLLQIYGADLHLLDNKWVLIYMYIGFGASLAVFFYHGVIKSIPVELEEAAMIDGANRLQTFFRIVFPLLLPATVTLIILDSLWIWNDYLLPSLILQSPGQRTLPLSTFAFYSTYSANFGQVMAALVMTAGPLLLAYLFLQRHIIRGIMSGSIK